MKIKVVIIDVALPPHTRRWVLRSGVLGVLLLGASAIAYANLPQFEGGKVLTADALNASFNGIDNRVVQLEASSAEVGSGIDSLDARLTVLEGRLGARSAFAAATQIVQSLSNVTVTPVSFPNEVFDLGGEYDPGSSTFSPKADGYYWVKCDLEWAPGSVGTYSVMLDVNGAQPMGDENEFTTTTSNAHRQASMVLSLKKNDQVRCLGWQRSNSAATLVVNSPSRSVFEGFRLPE